MYLHVFYLLITKVRESFVVHESGHWVMGVTQMSQKSHENVLSFPANQITLLLTLFLEENTLNLLWLSLYSHAQRNSDSYSFE